MLLNALQENLLLRKKVSIEEQAEVPKAPAPMSGQGASRRRFTRAGIGVTGVLLTLASQPGMATDICTSPSGSLSGGLQSHHGPAPICSGVAPDNWKNQATWPRGVTHDTRFGEIFSVNQSRMNTYGAATCIAMLEQQPFDEASLGMHLVATYLNILSGRISFLSIEALRNIWSEWQASGYYTPTAGVQWNAAAIVVYLSGTMN
jgi:hypothetical protein